LALIANNYRQVTEEDIARAVTGAAEATKKVTHQPHANSCDDS